MSVPMLVFLLNGEDSIINAARGKSGGTRVTLRLPAQIPAEGSGQDCFDNGKEGPPGVGAGV